MSAAYVSPPQWRGSFALSDVTVVDVDDGSLAPGQDVRVEQGRIASITNHDERDDGVSRVDVSGRFLIPGLVDAHCHPLNHPDEVDGAYALMLAAGVVGYRQMSGDDDRLARRAAGTLRQPAGAPALLALPGDLLTPITAPNPDAARRTVRHQAEAGADFIKAVIANRDAYLAALDEAAAVGLPMAGHLPDDVDPVEASRAGMRCMEHLGTGTALFGASSPCGHEIRAEQKGLPELPGIPRPVQRVVGKLSDPLMLKFVVNPSSHTPAATAQAYETLDASFDERLALDLAEVFIANQTWQCPTLIRLHTTQFPTLHATDPRVRYMLPAELSSWGKATQTYMNQAPEVREALQRHWESQLRLTKVFADAGVPMIAGTDASGGGWLIPGFALHDEFDLLADAGVGPLQILRFATRDAARFLGRDDVAGRIAVGYEADAVVLEDDPTRDVRGLHSIDGVLRAGDWFSRQDLDATLERLAADPTAR